MERKVNNMGCGCGLKPSSNDLVAIKTGAARLARSIGPEALALVEHMLYEEDHILPVLSPAEQREILADHARFWNQLARNIMPARAELDVHAAHEKVIYDHYGITHPE